MKPLENIIVLEFCQFLAGPSAGLRLADLGARVIKVERPDTGDNCRKLAIKDLYEDDDSLLFHTINRNKESYSANLKSPADIKKVKKLIEKADILTHNFRPGVMEKLGLDYETVKEINPKIVYAVITGYGNKGPWRTKPGQDLLIQSLSGLTWLTGDRGDPPIPFGLSIADLMSGTHLAQGILAALINRNKRNTGALIEVNLLASLIDFQFEVITTYLNDGGQDPVRMLKSNAHAYLSAPYGVYETKDGYIAIAMEKVDFLGALIDCTEIIKYKDSREWFAHRDEIIASLSKTLRQKNTREWLRILEPANIWCSSVYDYEKLIDSEAYKILQMEQDIQLESGRSVKTTRCPIRIDGARLFAKKRAPVLGAHTDSIDKEFDLLSI